ncbi:acid phosphatase 1-like [Juglans microcarpa x Juglans regia]|uniref:acid phosphatase 1-like n=1 Tax=Juglans microcarpa x Juglans regia TaxID=2249226 RepID=UPI001B7E0BEE|nr:acid phosphatase 1-like [Juglans microcarpa x Juglans regia]
MASGQFLTPIFVFLLCLVSTTASPSVIQISRENTVSGYSNLRIDDDLYCESWRFSVETNDAGYWSTIPARCLQFVEDYMTSERYLYDSEFVARDSLAFAKTVEMAGDGRDSWIFDIDETLLSNLPYYEAHGFGSESFDESSFDSWVDLAEAPALPASLSLYKDLKQLGFTLFLLTGRGEYQRNVTEKNLLYAEFTGWERLILRGPSDQGKPAIVYKSEKRTELQDEGYRIHGSSGDQWSDLLGFAIARRSFKLPNPMYYIA